MTRRAVSIIGTALFLFAAPGMVAGVIPWWISGWPLPAFNAPYVPVQVLGGVFILAGAAVVLDSSVRFAWQGLGVPLPVMPTKNLVVSGLYRWVRNPMYVAVVSIILGQAMIFASWPLLIYAAVVWACFHTFVLLHEEPTLRKTFGAEYDAFRSRVPRWIPKIPSGAR